MPFHASLVLANTEAGRGLGEEEAGGDGMCISPDVGQQPPETRWLPGQRVCHQGIPTQ